MPEPVLPEQVSDPSTHPSLRLGKLAAAPPAMLREADVRLQVRILPLMCLMLVYLRSCLCTYARALSASVHHSRSYQHAHGIAMRGHRLDQLHQELTRQGCMMLQLAAQLLFMPTCSICMCAVSLYLLTSPTSLWGLQCSTEPLRQIVCT